MRRQMQLMGIGSAVLAVAAAYVGINVLSGADREPTSPRTPQAAASFGGSAEEAAVPQQSKVEALRRQYPFRSLRERLSYEQDAVTDRPVPALTDESRGRLKDAETISNLSHYTARERSLALLHSEKAEAFVDADGFGLSRIIRTPSLHYLPLPEPVRIPFAVAPTLSADERHRLVFLPATREEAAQHSLRLPDANSVHLLHTSSHLQFLSPRSLGYARDLDHVAGFVPHAFRSMPVTENLRSASAEATEKWLIDELSLVSLLKHDEPRVYVSDHLPRMQDLDEVPTRLLDPFEQRSLDALRAGEDISTEATANRIRMFGSLRASKQCLECHQVRHGELLGAFSYVLQRDPPIDAEQADVLRSF